jgi:hypothetical protein
VIFTLPSEVFLSLRTSGHVNIDVVEYVLKYKFYFVNDNSNFKEKICSHAGVVSGV